MSDQRKTRAKQLIGGVVGSLILAIGLWAVPDVAGASDADAVAAPSTAADQQALTVYVNVPRNEIQDGQFCQAYAVVHNGNPPYKFTWSGQFTNADGQWGPLGEDQIVNGYIASFRGRWLIVEVQEITTNRVKADTVELNIDASYPYNPACEA